MLMHSFICDKMRIMKFICKNLTALTLLLSIVNFLVYFAIFKNETKYAAKQDNKTVFQNVEQNEKMHRFKPDSQLKPDNTSYIFTQASAENDSGELKERVIYCIMGAPN